MNRAPLRFHRPSTLLPISRPSPKNNSQWLCTLFTITNILIIILCLCQRACLTQLYQNDASTFGMEVDCFDFYVFIQGQEFLLDYTEHNSLRGPLSQIMNNWWMRQIYLVCLDWRRAFLWPSIHRHQPATPLLLLIGEVWKTNKQEKHVSKQGRQVWLLSCFNLFVLLLLLSNRKSAPIHVLWNWPT